MTTVQGTHGKQRERLSRERVVEAALAIMDSEGLEAVSMRRVARELGVEAMSLYNHVVDKEDLLQGIREHVMSQFLDPGTDGPWEERARAAGRSWRDALRAHPSMLSLIAESKGPNLSPASIRPTEVGLRLLTEIGLPEDEAVMAFCAFGGFIVGFVMFEMGMAKARQVATALPDPTQLAAALPAEQFPCFASALPYLVAGDIDARFEYGLDLMIAGLRARVSANG
jgi:AcrR family transcriptional regulator